MDWAVYSETRLWGSRLGFLLKFPCWSKFQMIRFASSSMDNKQPIRPNWYMRQTLSSLTVVHRRYFYEWFFGGLDSNRPHDYAVIFEFPTRREAPSVRVRPSLRLRPRLSASASVHCSLLHFRAQRFISR